MPIEISIAEQRLHFYQNGRLISEYPVSTATNGIGFEQGSYCTPVGDFEVSAKMGEGEPLHTIFRARKPVGVWGENNSHAEDDAAQDLILSRILWLHGLDKNNANTKDRYIYIHGTNHEDLLGTTASCGCIRMSNRDVVDLYDRVALGESVCIF